ncbi:MAG: AAA family ATPase [Chloroflexi bacterium]|nr:AAA family ATPase [Chloroflexota bacterium]
MQKVITDDLEALLGALPPHIAEPVQQNDDRTDLLEIVMDLGRLPEARYPGKETTLGSREVTDEDLAHVISRIGAFGDDNRAGIERTLHRISAIRNRKSRIIGLTCRIGRAVYGTIDIIRDIVESGKSTLLLGKPGIGKTTMLREMARVLADDLGKRVIIVDTSNEIAGDGDIPHPAIGHARRMQVATPTMQHAVMIEAVENHMPEVIVIDEIGTELEAEAARTIAERGVQLVGTAHGNTLENLMMNPTLADLVGGIQSVTLSDEEARRRGTQKSILERKAPPTFDVVIEILAWDRVSVHPDVASTVDFILRGQMPAPEIRTIDDTGTIKTQHPTAPAPEREREAISPRARHFAATTRIFPYGISRTRLEEAAKEMQITIQMVNDIKNADLVMTAKNYYRSRPQTLRDAEARGVPVYVLRNNTVLQIEQSLADIFDVETGADPVSVAMSETEEAIEKVLNTQRPVELSPQTSYIRRLQHQLVEHRNLASRSTGREPHRRVTIYKEE